MTEENETYQHLLREISDLKERLHAFENSPVAPPDPGTPAPRPREQVPFFSPSPSSRDTLVLHVDRTGRLTYLNAAALDCFGYAESEILGRSVIGTLVPAYSGARTTAGGSASDALIEASPETLSRLFSRETRHASRDGRVFVISWTTTPVIGDGGSVTGFICTGADITEHKRLNERTAQYMSDLAFLSYSAMYFVEHAPGDDIFRFIADQLHLLAGNAVAVVWSCSPGCRTATFRAVAGFDKDLDVLARTLGRSPAGLSVPLSGSHRRMLGSGMLSEMGSVAEVFFGHLPASAAAALARELSAGTIHRVPFLSQGETLAFGAIVMRAGSSLPRPELVEAFVNQSSVALKRARTEEQLKRAAEEWRMTFDSISDLIMTLDRGRKIIRVNKALAAAYGLQPKDFVGKRGEVFPGDPGTLLPFCVSDAELAPGKPVVKEIEGPLDGHYELSVTPIFDEHHQVASTIHVAKDITQRREAEAVLRRDRETLGQLVEQKTQELLGAQKELEDAKRLSDIGVLAATIAHEIRNPLAAIRTAVYNIRRKNREANLESHLANIDKKVQESDQIIRNLLSYSRIKHPNYEPVRVFDIMEESLASVAEKYARWNVRLERLLTGRRNGVIEADPVHLQVLLYNLLDNAYQAIPDKNGRITVSAVLKPPLLTVTITDTGTGIVPEDLAHISEPFFTKKSRGIGLGLTVCHQIVALHHGTIAISSEQGKGTTVTVTLPTRKPV